jgi:hypothetical protein
MKKLILLLVIITFVSVEAQRKAKNDPDFVRWRNQYKKDKWEDKDSDSIERRAERVLEKRRKCADHNKAREEDPEITWECGSNEYDHLTSEEVESRLKGLKPPLEARALPKFYSYTSTNAPTSYDWTSFCKPIQNQGSCGCCWAFATLGVIECYNKIKNVNLPLLSPQFLVDCDVTTNNNRCNGGWPTSAFTDLKNMFGTSAPAWADYPFSSVNYTSTKTGYSTCKNTVPRYPLGYTNVYQTSVNGNEATMRSIVVNFGPVAVGVYASSAFMSYKSGVFSDSTCPKATTTIPQCDYRNLNHGKELLFFKNLIKIFFLKLL